MDLEQRFLKASEFDVEESFMQEMSALPFKEFRDVLDSLASISEHLPINKYANQKIYGTIKGTDKFFELYFYNSGDDVPIFLDFRYTDCDSYLDAINIKKTIKTFYNGSKKIIIN